MNFIVGGEKPHQGFKNVKIDWNLKTNGDLKNFQKNSGGSRTAGK